MDYLGIDLSCAMGSLRNGEFPAKDCLLPLISKLLGYFLVAASVTVKLPQIMKIVDNKSVKGLSVVAFELEVIWKNFRNKSTGQLSFLTCFMNFSGAMARVFTSIQANAPLSIFMGIFITLFTNGTIMSQILLYRSKGKEEKQVKGKKIS